ncbi:hypothetical protein HMPREF1222_01740 [Treponema vincentii F0403]|uniref:Uncharacterized protein n=1 Tax=Treponema vincentii F0403 TaxID=1125702 RepID=S3L710_9SPIR|nr:hypothetical protein [Treponema vincentii]EPF46228.1 hypothetical protein HMPREF1222_01740 [Treponema vincentii F0403]
MSNFFIYITGFQTEITDSLCQAPEILYCAGTFEQSRYIYPSNVQQVGERVYTVLIGGKPVYVIDYYHPAGSYGSYNELYRLLLQAFHGLAAIEIQYDEKELICRTASGALIPHQSIVPEHTEIELWVQGGDKSDSCVGYSSVCWTVNGSVLVDSVKPSIRYTVGKQGNTLARQNDRYISAETTDKLPPHQFSLINNVLCSDTYAEGYCCEHKTENRDFIGHTGAITAHRCRNFYANVKTGGCA